MHSEETILEIPIMVPSERTKRLQALSIAIAAIALLSVALYLHPSPDGIGTHQQLGLPQCGWILTANLPCPTCGMTTAWSHTVRGELPSAFLAQPMGMLLAIATMGVAICAIASAAFGVSFQFLLFRLATMKVWIIIAVVALASWGFKILMYRGML